MNITGKGTLGVILMRALDMTYEEAMEALDAIEAVAKRKGVFIDVEQLEDL